MKEKIRAAIEREMELRLDYDSFLKNTQEILRKLPDILAEAVAKELALAKDHGKNCFCRDCLEIIYENLIDFNS